jgi:hypothetical protein
MGAIYMSENSTPSARTRHADIRQKFTADLQDKSLVKVDFVKSEDNTSDILTKNVSVELFKYHTKHIVMDKSEVDGKGYKSSVRKGVGKVTDSLSPSLTPVKVEAPEVLDPSSEEQEHLKMQRTRSNDQGSSHPENVG